VSNTDFLNTKTMIVFGKNNKFGPMQILYKCIVWLEVWLLFFFVS